MRRMFRQQPDLNASRQRKVALHPLLVNHFAMELCILERQSHMIGNRPKYAFIGARKRASLLIQQLQNSNGLAILIPNGKAKERLRAKTKTKIDFRFEPRVSVSISKIYCVAGRRHAAGDPPANR